MTQPVETLTATQKKTIQRSIAAPHWLLTQIRSAGRSAFTSAVMASPPTVASSASALAQATQTFAATAGTAYITPDQVGSWIYASVYVRGYSSFSTLSGNQDDSSTATPKEAWANGCIADFWCDCTYLSIKGISSPSTTIEVDGELTSLTPTAFGSGNGYINITFASQKVRRVRLFVAMFAWGIHQISVDVLGRVWKPSPGRSIQFFGDSITSGTGSEATPGANWTRVFGDLTGFSSAISTSMGGTGFVNAGSHGTIESRLSYLVPGVDVIALVGSVNDSGSSGAAIQAAVTSALTAARTANSSAVIALFGVNGGKSAADATNETNMKTAFDAWSDGNKLWIPSMLATGGSHIFGTGKTTATTGDGNADVYLSSDGTHPNVAGHGYIASRYSNELSRALEAI